MEVELAGWSLDPAKLFKRSSPASRGRKAPEVLAADEPQVQQLPRPKADRSGSSKLPRFQSTANDLPARRSGDQLELVRAKLRHAFTPSQPVAERKMFAGREGVLQTIIDSIEDQRLHVVLYGERGIGKTSLLHMLARAATEARYIVIYTSCGANSNFDETIRAAAAEIPVLFHSGFAPTAERAEKGDTLSDLLPPGPVTPGQFSDLCAKLTGTRVLLILDEFDRCESEAFRRDVAELIKNLSDRLGRVQLILAGVAADLTQLVAHIPSIRRNIYALRVPMMADEEVVEIVRNGQRELGVSFDPPAQELVVAVSRGSPYIANLLCHHAVQAALLAGRTRIMLEDVVDAVDRTRQEFSGRIGKAIQHRVGWLLTNGHSVELDLASRTSLSADGPFSVSDMEVLAQVDRSQAERATELLLHHGLLRAIHDGEGTIRFEFMEDGLPMYLWIASAMQSLRPAEMKSRASTR